MFLCLRLSLFASTGRTGYYLKLLIFVCFCLAAVQIAFQILLAVLGNDLIAKCEFLEVLLRHVGVIRLDDLEWASSYFIHAMKFHFHNSTFDIFQRTINNAMDCSRGDIVRRIHSCFHRSQESFGSGSSRKWRWWTATTCTSWTWKWAESRKVATSTRRGKGGVTHRTMCDWCSATFGAEFRLLRRVSGRSYVVGL